MRVAVVLSTYNQPALLASTLIGYATQTHSDFELIIADDGSTAQTREVIEQTVQRFARPIRHVWQEDQGFRKCRILNQAILSTTADYVIFSDGDCIPRADFVATHIHHARPNRFLSGGYVKLNAEASASIKDSDVLSGLALAPDWLGQHGMSKDGKLWRLTRSRWQSQLLNRLTTTRATWNGHNASGWRRDLLRINGFDERMAYWAQDREFGERLENAGIRGVQIRYSAICVHLHHERPYKNAASRERNRAIRRETRRTRSTWTPFGLLKSVAAPSGTDSIATAISNDVAIFEHHPA